MTDRTVLVVDDDFMVASIHIRFVERIPGFAVVGTAATGGAALDEIERLRPDLVLLDVHLPDMTGIEVLRTLRAAGNQVGVVMVTAAREADTVRAAAAGGAAHYIVKPFEFDDLRVRLEAWRDAQDALTAETPAQDDIDAVFTPVVAGPPKSLPKGLSVPTADSVLRGARLRRRGVGERVRRAGRHLPGLRPPLPRALRRDRAGHGPAAVRRRPPRTPLPRLSS